MYTAPARGSQFKYHSLLRTLYLKDLDTLVCTHLRGTMAARKILYSLVSSRGCYYVERQRAVLVVVVVVVVAVVTAVVLTFPLVRIVHGLDVVVRSGGLSLKQV